MDFRLVLRGHLPPDKRGTGDAKHRIRRELHPQLRTLWKKRWAGWFNPPNFDPKHPERPLRSVVDKVADEYARCGFRFVPLVRTEKRNGEQWACSLNFLILRREEPHRLFYGSGDLDGRIKTLIDGLRMPQQCSEVAGHAPSEDEDPFFVLLDDDKWIYDFSVTTDVLLVPPEPNEPQRDVVAVIEVKIRTSDGGDPFAVRVY